MKVLHIITGLYTGGAEMMLYKILSNMDRKRFEPVVLTLTNGGYIINQIEGLGVPVHCIGMDRGRLSAGKLVKFLRSIKTIRPDLIQGWMYHGNLAALMAGFILEKTPVLWNIRHSVYSLENEKRSTALVIKAGAVLSNKPRYILYNSKVSARQHEGLGYCSAKSVIIPNGFDTEAFKPIESARMKIREQLGLASSTILIGLIARYHPMKDHQNFLTAAKILLQRFPNVHFLLVGQGIDTQNNKLMQILRELGISTYVHMLGECKNMTEVTAALDIATSSSFGEGFPNVIGEAMSCGVPCVVTNVGDSAWVVGETGLVIPPQNSNCLAEAWTTLLDMGHQNRELLGTQARERVKDHFSLEFVTAEYEKLYEKAVK